MALDFPNTPTDGQIYIDPATRKKYTYEAATNSWTAMAAVAAAPTLPNALTYKGQLDVTAAKPAGLTPAVGDTYIANKAGTVHASWTGIGGSAVTLHELLVWDGVEWDGAGVAASSRKAYRGEIDLTTAKPPTFGTPEDGDLYVLKYGTWDPSSSAPKPAIHADWVTDFDKAEPDTVVMWTNGDWNWLNGIAQAFPGTGVWGIVESIGPGVPISPNGGKVISEDWYYKSPHCRTLFVAGTAVRPSSPIEYNLGDVVTDDSSLPTKHYAIGKDRSGNLYAYQILNTELANDLYIKKNIANLPALP